MVPTQPGRCLSVPGNVKTPRQDVARTAQLKRLTKHGNVFPR